MTIHQHTQQSAEADLARLGDELEHAVARQITGTIVSRRRRRRSRGVLIGSVLAGGVVVAGGAAAAVSLLSTGTVETGMPGGSAIFTGTHPTCTTTDQVVFDCTLRSAPTEEAVANYRGVKETFVDDDSRVAGGCVGTDAAGLHWTCYAGQRAVDEGITGQGLLGQRSLGPARG
jgi:hypothetical protein